MNTKLPLLCIALSMSSVACKKDSPIQPDTTTVQQEKVTADVLDLERFINELEFIARNIKLYYPNRTGILMGTTITSGHTDEGKLKYDIVFDGLNGQDGRRRDGKLSVVFEDAVENGTTVWGKHLHVRSDDEAQLYSVGEIKFKGSMVFSNLGNSPNTTTDHLNAQSFLIKPDGEQIRFSSRRKSKWITGYTNTEAADDAFELSDQQYSLSISKAATLFVNVQPIAPAMLSLSCTQSLFLPKAGKLTIELLGGKTWNINLGKGDCSDHATIE